MSVTYFAGTTVTASGVHDNYSGQRQMTPATTYPQNEGYEYFFRYAR